MKLVQLLSSASLVIPAFSVAPLVRTTTGPILGTEVARGVLAWKGIPFAVPPTGVRRWTLPVLNKWTETKHTNSLGPACIQQFDKVEGVDLSQLFYNTPPLSEDEDCLTINIWAPTNSSTKSKAVLFWIFGGGFQFGGSGTFMYDGTSLAQNQDVIVVSHNYRTNVFGFPNSPELPSQQKNLALFDQQLALSWTRDNIAKFGGDPDKITLFGQSAGSGSVALLLERYPKHPPFRAAILQSGVATALLSNPPDPTEELNTWNAIAAHFGCPMAKGASQINCLKNVSAHDLEQFTIDNGMGFGPVADGGATVPDEPLLQLKKGAIARVPIMIGDNAQGGSFLTVGQNNFTAFISQPPLESLPADELRALYAVPGRFENEAQAIVALQTDIQFRCRSARFSDIFANKGISTVYRFVFGAILSEFQIFPNAGAPEGAEMPSVFGNLNGTTTNATELSLSRTMQTIWANFAKHPNQPPAPNWSAYKPTKRAIAALAFDNNVELDVVVDLKNGSTFDRACQLLDTLAA